MSKRIIAVDGTPLFRKIDGVGRYSYRLLMALADRHPETDFHVVAFADDKDKKPLAEERSNIHYRYLPWPRRAYQAVFKKFRPVAVDRFLGFKPDITLYFNFVKSPLIVVGKSLVVVHDLAYKDVPDTVSERNRIYLDRFVPWSCEHTDRIVAVSAYTRSRLHAEYGYALDKISVVEPGIEPLLKPQPSILKAVKAKFGLPDTFTLFVGTIEPRKNLINVLRAYELAAKKKMKLQPLVLVGTKGWNLDRQINGLIEKLRVDNSVHVLGYVDDSELPAVYYQADMFVLPSLYEGFGIPLLEAMRCKLPVAASNREPMNSLAPKSAPRFDPESPERILDALLALSGDEKLKAKVAAQGYKIARQYTWQNGAKLLSQEIEKVLKEK